MPKIFKCTKKHYVKSSRIFFVFVGYLPGKKIAFEVIKLFFACVLGMVPISLWKMIKESRVCIGLLQQRVGLFEALFFPEVTSS